MAFLLFVSRFNHLLYHLIAEIFCIIIAFGIFFFSWNTRKFVQKDYLVFIGLAYPFIGILDIIHTLAYTGMNVFNISSPDPATQLWIAARFMESAVFLIAPLYITRRVKITVTLTGFIIYTATMILTIFYWPAFPACYVPGTGLTGFKIGMEYLIMIMLVVAGYYFYRQKGSFDAKAGYLIMLSILMTILSEFSFTLYFGVFDISNQVGHFLKLVSYFLIYRAVIRKGLQQPFNIIFRELQAANNQLNIEIDGHKKADLENEKLIRDLRKSLAEIKILRGILPICSYCKKIRSDDGYWNQVEVYIHEHSEVDFSHSVCPDCLQKYYGKYFPDKKDKSAS